MQLSFIPCCSNDATRSDDEVGPSIKETAPKPYTPTIAASLFDTYADPDTASSSNPTIGPEGFEQLCNDAQISLDGALPLIMAWVLESKEMAKIGKDEWTKATSTLQISSLHTLVIVLQDIESLILFDRPAVPRQAPNTPVAAAKKGSTKGKDSKQKDPYNRDQYWKYADDKKGAFLKLYGFCFSLAKPEQARNIDMETATAFWSVLLTPRYPIITDVIEFINEKGSYKGANKDLWGMMLEFCQSVKPTLEDYEADGAWPTLLDEFVIWKKSKTAVTDPNE